MTTCTAPLPQSIKCATNDAIDQKISEYLHLQAEKAIADEKMKSIKKELTDFAMGDKSRFDKDGNYKLPSGYLHLGKKSVEKVNAKKFNLLKFVKAFPELMKRELKVGAIKEILKDKAGKAKLAVHGVSLTQIDTLEILPTSKE